MYHFGIKRRHGMIEALIIVAAFALGGLSGLAWQELAQRRQDRKRDEEYSALGKFIDAFDDEDTEDEDDRKEKEKKEQRGFFD